MRSFLKKKFGKPSCFVFNISLPSFIISPVICPIANIKAIIADEAHINSQDFVKGPGLMKAAEHNPVLLHCVSMKRMPSP